MRRGNHVLSQIEFSYASPTELEPSRGLSVNLSNCGYAGYWVRMRWINPTRRCEVMSLEKNHPGAWTCCRGCQERIEKKKNSKRSGRHHRLDFDNSRAPIRCKATARPRRSSQGELQTGLDDQASWGRSFRIQFATVCQVTDRLMGPRTGEHWTDEETQFWKSSRSDARTWEGTHWRCSATDQGDNAS
jgi:hypothetical protein